MANYYGYKELVKAATRPGASQDDINALGEWFSEHGTAYWNGECYDADGRSLYPLIKWDDEADIGSVVGYEFR